MKSDNAKKYIYDLVTPVSQFRQNQAKLHCKATKFFGTLPKGVGICFEMGYHIFDPHSRSI